MPLNDEQFLRFERYSGLLNAHGYWISAEPIEGMEEVFLADLKQACAKVEETAAWLRKRWGYRGLSKRLLEELHISLRCPSENVDSCLFAEITNRERR